MPTCLRGLTFLLPHTRLFKHLLTYDSLPPRPRRSYSDPRRSHVTRRLTAAGIKGCRSDPGGGPRRSSCNSAFLDKDNFICNPGGKNPSGAPTSPLPLVSVQLVARLPSGGVLRLVLGLVPVRVAPASLAPVGGGFPPPSGPLRGAGAGSPGVGEGLRGPAGGPLRVPAVGETGSGSGTGAKVGSQGLRGGIQIQMCTSDRCVVKKEALMLNCGL